MQEARKREEWWHTASLLAAIQNIFAPPGRQVTAEDCHPMERGKPPAITLRTGQFGVLKDIFGCK